MVERLNIWLKFLAANLLNLDIWVNLNYMILNSMCSEAGGEEKKEDVVIHEAAGKSHSKWKSRWRIWFSLWTKQEVKQTWTGCNSWTRRPPCNYTTCEVIAVTPCLPLRWCTWSEQYNCKTLPAEESKDNLQLSLNSSRDVTGLDQ